MEKTGFVPIVNVPNIEIGEQTALFIMLFCIGWSGDFFLKILDPTKSPDQDPNKIFPLTSP